MKHKAVPIRGGIKKTDLIESLQYSGLGLTENSTEEEILTALREEFPASVFLHNAEEITENTGGWGTVKYVPNDDYHSNYISFSSLSGYLKLDVSTTTHNSVGYMYAKNKIDLTQYTKLCIDVEITGSSKTCFYAYIASKLPTSTTTPDLIKNISSGVMERGILEIDISDVAQACYIVFRIYKSSAWGSTSHTIKIHKVWLE